MTQRRANSKHKRPKPDLVVCPVVIYGHGPVTAKGRKHQRITGSIAKSKLSRQSVSREREPWLLASNLKQSEWSSAKILAIYKRRMQIEEGFRDVKSEHLGQLPKRIEASLIIAALANYLLFLARLQAQERDLERRCQSNRHKVRRVLSWWRPGMEYWRSCTDFDGREGLIMLEKGQRDEVRDQAQSLA